jgi:hypothetical protein
VSVDIAFDQLHVFINPPGHSAVRLVLPEIVIRDGAHVRRIRVIALLSTPTSSRGLRRIERRDIVELNSAELGRLLEDRTTATSIRLFSANWLSQLDPAVARDVLVRVAEPLESGDLLATCMLLLARLGGEAFAPRALELLQDPAVPASIRATAAEYLAAARHEPSRTALETAARDRNHVVAAASRRALESLTAGRK